MRLKNIEKPKSFLAKLSFWMSKRVTGKVLAPFKLIYARSTPILLTSLKIKNTDKKLSLQKEYITLIRSFVSILNHCEWCTDFQAYESQKDKIDFVKVKELMQYQQSNNYTDKEKAMLAFVEEITLTKNVSNHTFKNLAHFFNDKEIVEITWVNASENYFNLLGKPLGLKSDNLFSPSKCTF